MRLERQGDLFRLEVTAAELRLLRRALERASFIDTPVSEQAEIAAFCARTLDVLGEPPGGARSPE
jgi:hypothetical protein